jgi:hypothetical protein
LSCVRGADDEEVVGGFFQQVAVLTGEARHFRDAMQVFVQWRMAGA